MNRALIILLIASLAVNAAAAVTFGYYWWGGRRPERRSSPRWMAGGPDAHPEFLKQRLGLTDEQMERIDAAREKVMSEMLSLQTESAEKKRQLMTLVDAEEVEQGRVDDLLSEVAAIQSKIEKQMFWHLRELRGILTPEQRKDMFKMLERKLQPPVPDRSPPGGPLERRMRTGPEPGRAKRR